MAQTLKEKLVEGLSITEEARPASQEDFDPVDMFVSMGDALHASRGSLTQERFSIYGDFSEVDSDKIHSIVRDHYGSEGYVCTDDGLDDMTFEKDGKRYLAIWDTFTDELSNFRFRSI